MCLVLRRLFVCLFSGHVCASTAFAVDLRGRYDLRTGLPSRVAPVLSASIPSSSCLMPSGVDPASDDAKDVRAEDSEELDEDCTAVFGVVQSASAIFVDLYRGGDRISNG